MEPYCLGSDCNWQVGLVAELLVWKRSCVDRHSGIGNEAFVERCYGGPNPESRMSFDD